MTLKELVSGRSVAIVGNAPTVTTFDHATKIDQCDVAIRFNRYSLNFPNVGTRTDVIAFPLGYRKAIPPMAMRNGVRLLLAVCPKLDASVLSNRAVLSDTEELELFDTSFFSDISRQLGCRSTTGFAVLCYILQKCNPRSVYVTGMSFQRLSKGHYMNGEKFNYTDHDPVKELQLYARFHRPELVEVDPHMHKRLTQRQSSHEFAQLQKRKGGDYSEPHRWVYQTIAERIPGRSVLEVGAGIGYGISLLLEAGCEVAAMEPDEASYRFLRSKFSGLPILNDTLGGFDSKVRFDAATCVEVVEHLSALEVHPFLCKLRALADRLLLSSPDRRKHSHGTRTQLEWNLALRAAGWKITEVSTHKWALLFDCV